MDKTDAVMKSAVMGPEAERLSMKEEGSAWRHYWTLAKMGIVNSNLLTAFAGYFLAASYTAGFQFTQNIHLLILTMLGIGLVMAGGCTINNYIDRDIDGKMERTRERPTATGHVQPKNVLAVGVLQAAVGLGLLVSVELVAAFIALVGFFVYVVLYSMWTKRTHSLNTIVGSISGAVPPLVGWAAVDPALHQYAWILFAIMFVWQPPHFLALAMKRCEEYRAAGIPMLPVVAGFEMTKRQIIVYVAALLPVSLLLFEFGAFYTTVTALLGAGWLVLGLAGFKMKDDVKWARLMFVYSLNYLTILFVLMIIIHI
ncbi:protoheme IX farnesyltransferase [Salsuginibacillus halophilus]|uniref:Protoheme IX farnesyltransferase n=1 Tax=Salsuginibacillus halophilus TaxID=517424 RepID=A0A2P8HXA6_9BACI|nr:heme o synthase [Salsuginibacillus halophilus]PSL50828.1 protoheme IX farnesyltransferase [Salsuginibacillus halophilus]